MRRLWSYLFPPDNGLPMMDTSNESWVQHFFRGAETERLELALKVIVQILRERQA